jgi:hypothetical protein
VERAFLWVAEVVMLAAYGCFVRGFLVRRSDRALHMRLGKLGALLVFVGLVAVELVARVLHWRFPRRDVTLAGCSAFTVHVSVASLALLVLVLLVWTGLKGPRALHVKLYALFFPLYTATIVLSFLAFQLW